MKRFSFPSLHVRLLLLVLLSVIPALGLTLYTGLEQRRHAVKYVQSDALHLAKLISAEQERMIVGVRQFLYTLGQLPHVRKLDKVACRRLFADLLKQYPYYLNIGVATIDGNIFASAIPLTQSVNITDRLYFQQAFKTRKFAIGEYQIGRIHGKPSVNFGYPIFDEEDRVKAIIFASLDLDWIYQLASQTELPQGSTVSLIDKEGKILVRYPDPGSWIGKTIPEASIINTILVQSEGMFEADDVKGVPRLYVFKSFGSTLYQVGNICVSIGIPISVAFAQVNRILIRNLAFLGFVSLLVLGIAWFLGDLLLLRQVDGLVSVARRLGAGDLTARTGILYNTGEIGQLAQTFDMMAGSLEKRENEGRRAEEAARQVAQENAIMAEIGRIISSSLNIDEVYERFAEEMHKLIPFDRITINLTNYKDHTFNFAYLAGVNIGEVRQGDAAPMAGTATEQTVLGRSGVIIQLDDENEVAAKFPRLLINFRAGIRSTMTAPLFSKDQVIGVLSLQAIKPNLYTEEHLRLGERVANQIAGAIANAQLFIEHRKSEEALSRLAAIVQESVDAIFTLDNQDQFTFWNRGAELLFGYRPEEILGQSFTLLLPPGRHEEVQKIRALLSKEGFVRNFEAERLNKEGQLIPVNITLMEMRDKEGQRIGLIAIQRDISEGKKIATERESHYQELKTLHEISQTILSSLDLKTISQEILNKTISLCSLDLGNIRLLDASGEFLEPVVGYGYRDPKNLERQRKQINDPTTGRRLVHVITSKTPWVEENVSGVDGMRIFKAEEIQSLVIVPVRAQEKILGTLHLGSRTSRKFQENDIRLLESIGNQLGIAIQKVQLYEDTRRAYDQLKTNHERMINTEKALRQSEDQLRQSQRIEAIGRLAGGIAHDFNNLLTVIKGYSELSLITLKEDNPLRGNIVEIRKASLRAADLTHQLLAFSRRQILEFKVFDLNAILQNLYKMLRRVIGEDIEMIFLLPDDMGKVKSDPGQIEQMILNLAVNARDAMPSGGKLIFETANVELDQTYASTHFAIKPGHYVMLSVSDTGCGMSPEVKEHLFEPFFTTKEKGKGTGLGLSTVYGIVKQSEGEICCYSEPGQGTTFKIYLPRVEEEASTLLHEDGKDSLSCGRETILLVEDELSLRGLAVRVLRENGYKLLEAANGNEALRMTQEYAGEIHLLLTDVVMPQMGGKELAQKLKTLRPEIKVLFTSGYTDNAIVHHGVLEPGIDFLQKPFSPGDLTQKVRKVLDK